MKRHHSEGRGRDSSPPPKRRSGKGGKGGGGKGGGKGIGSKSSRIGAPPEIRNGGLGYVRRYVFKCLCTDPFAANLIGRGGVERQAIEEDTGCFMWISKREDLYPSPEFRLLILHADEASQLQAALHRVIPKLIEVAERDRELGDGESPLLGKEPNEYVFYAALPSLIRARLIGKGGGVITKLREDTGTKIFVENETYDEHQAARIIGTPEKIQNVLDIISDMVQEEADTKGEEFIRWAQIKDFHNPGPPRPPQEEPPAGWGRDPPPRRERKGKKNQRRRRGGSKGDRAKGEHDDGFEQHEEPWDENEDDQDFVVPDGPPLEVLAQLSGEFHEDRLEMLHCVFFEIPSSGVEDIVGPNQEYLNLIEEKANTQIKITEGTNNDNSENEPYSNISIQGPLLSVYLAHFLIMKRYHDIQVQREREAAAQAKQDEEQEPEPEDTQTTVESLKAQLANLQSQLEKAESSRRR